MTESKSVALPLGYRAIFKVTICDFSEKMVGADGFEPPRLSDRMYSPTHSATLPNTQNGAQDWI